MIFVRQMDPQKITGQDGRWSLRHAILAAGGEDLHGFLGSEWAPVGTRVADLKPVELTLLGVEDDELKLDVAELRDLLAWPPRASS